MRSGRQTRTRAARGFSLPAVMIVTAGALALAVGVLLVVGIERRTARGFVDRQRAELAARSGMEELRAVLLEQAANDEFMVVEGRAAKAEDPLRDPASYLYLVRGTGDGKAIGYRYHPLFSSESVPEDSDRLEAPDPEALVGVETDAAANFGTLPWMDDVRVAWTPVKDREGRTVARYAYWAEDLQGRLDAATAGNVDGESGSHVRNDYPFPAPGLNPEPEDEFEPGLDRVALHVLDPASGAEDASDVDDRLIEGRDLLVTPGSVLAAAGVEPPLERGDDGRLVDPVAAALEESVAAGIRHYDEQPRVPWLAGIDPAAAGQPKRNLNRMLADGRSGAIDEFADWVGAALPEFRRRAGGFPDDYLRTLAAGAFDYADTDGDASVEDGVYRGLDAYPLVSEFLMRFRWERITVEKGRKYVVLSASTYVELWNMTDQPVEGEARVNYDANYTFPLGPVPSIWLGDPDLLDDPEVVTSLLEKSGERYWFPALPVALQPNEYRVHKLGEVTYKIDAGPASVWIPSPLELDGDDVRSGYVMEWNGVPVDGAGGMLRRYNATLNYPTDTASKPRQKVRGTIPGHSYKRGFTYINNMGDPRIAIYNDAPQDANAYPENYSPNRRTIRWGTIYSRDAPSKPKVYGRVLPSEWPDGGHDSDYGPNSFQTSDERRDPDDERFFRNLPTPLAIDAPQRISNLGRFFSETELGRVFDPVMWDNGAPAGPGRPWPDVGDGSSPSGDFGGGNSLRIGRPEHPRFDRPGLRASRLLDLFHAGRSRSDDAALREGPTVRIEGHVNLNTATPDALRALAAGRLQADPALARTTSKAHVHDVTTKMAEPVEAIELSAPTRSAEADLLAEAIVAARPFASPSQLADLLDDDGRPLFGNRDQYPDGETIQWADAAAEELFARVYQASAVRSRNLRVWVIGQAVSPVAGPDGPEVLAEARMVFNLFANPGERDADGAIAPENFDVEVTYENTF